MDVNLEDSKSSLLAEESLLDTFDTQLGDSGDKIEAPGDSDKVTKESDKYSREIQSCDVKKEDSGEGDGDDGKSYHNDNLSVDEAGKSNADAVPKSKEKEDVTATGDNNMKEESKAEEKFNLESKKIDTKESAEMPKDDVIATKKTIEANASLATAVNKVKEEPDAEDSKEVTNDIFSEAEESGSERNKGSGDEASTAVNKVKEEPDAEDSKEVTNDIFSEAEESESERNKGSGDEPAGTASYMKVQNESANKEGFENAFPDTAGEKEEKACNAAIKENSEDVDRIESAEHDKNTIEPKGDDAIEPKADDAVEPKADDAVEPKGGDAVEPKELSGGTSLDENPAESSAKDDKTAVENFDVAMNLSAGRKEDALSEFNSKEPNEKREKAENPKGDSSESQMTEDPKKEATDADTKADESNFDNEVEIAKACAFEDAPKSIESKDEQKDSTSDPAAEVENETHVDNNTADLAVHAGSGVPLN